MVYPNPSNLEYVNVSTSEAILSAQIINTIGQEVMAKEGNKTDKSMIIETAGLPKGVYFVKMSFAKGKSTVVKLSIQ